MEGNQSGAVRVAGNNLNCLGAPPCKISCPLIGVTPGNNYLGR
jgi:hypothetical protein